MSTKTPMHSIGFLLPVSTVARLGKSDQGSAPQASHALRLRRNLSSHVSGGQRDAAGNGPASQFRQYLIGLWERPGGYLTANLSCSRPGQQFTHILPRADGVYGLAPRKKNSTALRTRSVSL